MKRAVLGFSFLAVVLGIPGTGTAGTLDHLLCYKMTDPIKLQTYTDMIAELQPEFTQKGCLIIKPVKFCVPATKHVNVAASKAAPLNPNIIGQPLKNDYVCYKTLCKQPVPPPDKLVFDQFGARLEEKFQPTEICVPAAKRPPFCGTYNNKCQGACPDPKLECKIVKANGTATCDCAPKSTPCGGKPNTAGLCSGECPDPADVCRLSYVVDPANPTAKPALTCNCQHPDACGLNTATGQCGGPCPLDTQTCQLNVDGICTCQDAPAPCHVDHINSDNSPACGGVCPPLADGTVPQCLPDPTTGKCSCTPPQHCTQDPTTGTCGGECPAGLICTLDAAGQCNCQDAPCGVTQTSAGPACAGPCPPGKKCIADATGACNCRDQQVDPCVAGGASVCNPPCPSGQSCSVVPGTTVCRCQCDAASCTPPCPAGSSCSLNGTGGCACQ
jgi:hypothetical protein